MGPCPAPSFQSAEPTRARWMYCLARWTRGGELESLGELGGDRGRQRAAGAVVVVRLDPRRGEADRQLPRTGTRRGLPRLDDVTALDEHEARPGSAERLRGGVLALDRVERIPPEERGRFTAVRGDGDGVREQVVQVRRARRPRRAAASPVDDTMTGSTTRFGSRPAAARSATTLTLAVVASMPVLTAATGRSSSTASIWSRRSPGSVAATPAHLGRVLGGEGADRRAAVHTERGERAQVGLDAGRRHRSPTRRSSGPPVGWSWRAPAAGDDRDRRRRAGGRSAGSRTTMAASGARRCPSVVMASAHDRHPARAGVDALVRRLGRGDAPRGVDGRGSTRWAIERRPSGPSAGPYPGLLADEKIGESVT